MQHGPDAPVTSLPPSRLSVRLGIGLAVLVCLPRFYLVLLANRTGSYFFIGLIMLVSGLLPFVILSRHDRRRIGIRRSRKYDRLLLAFGTGVLMSWVIYAAGYGLYGETLRNWYVYIARSYAIPPDLSATDRNLLFIGMAAAGMTFSPIGEEFFFRGLIHSCFAGRWGGFYATVIDSGLFALVHLSHFGIVYVNGGWDFYFIPALLWLLFMFLSGVVFYVCRRATRSIWGAVLCHSGFNFGMIYAIFYWLGT
jgi:membrane protease YdiL (CAAX protease family)